METITVTPTHPRQSWKVLAGAAAAVAVVAGVVGLASLGGSSKSAATPAAVDIQATDSGLNITGLDRLKPGNTRIENTNTTDSDHAMIVAKLHEGVTPDQMLTALQSPDGIESLSLADFYGGVDDIPHHTTWAETVDLTPGTYVIVDHAQATDDSPAWFNKPGFYVPFTVAETSATNAAKPKPDAVITMRDFSYEMPASLPQDGIVEFRNEGNTLHMGVLLKLNPGVTVDEVMQNLSPDTTLGTPGEFLGVTSPGLTVSVEQHFEPGTYVIACLMPDMQADGTPHAMEGMISSFTVS